jgi:hypothetical protein
MLNHDRTGAIHQLLGRLDGLDPVKQPFWSELNYDHLNQPIPRRNWTANLRALLTQVPVLLAGDGDDQSFQIIYPRLASPRLLLTPELTSDPGCRENTRTLCSSSPTTTRIAIVVDARQTRETRVAKEWPGARRRFRGEDPPRYDPPQVKAWGDWCDLQGRVSRIRLVQHE